LEILRVKTATTVKELLQAQVFISWFVEQ